MSGNIFLFLQGIPGESTAACFNNWIDIASFSIGVSMEVNQDGRLNGGHALSGAADPEDLSFDKKMDVATPLLFHCCAIGAVIPSGRVIQCNDVGAVGKDHGGRLPVADYTFGDAIITSMSSNASGGGIADDSFSINYGSIVWRYHYYNHYMVGRSNHVVEEIQREWSIITSNTKDADKNTKDIAKIDCGCPGSYTELGTEFNSKEINDENNIDALHNKVNFKPGKVVNVSAPASNIYSDKDAEAYPKPEE